ncbi:MAG: DUF1292 domain-containing protein [Clostridia bacterium]|nr:DUF1292 domain-containing protein [Clostridia bacterium]
MDDGRIMFTVPGENGEDVECEALFTFEDSLTGKNYLLYTDYSVDELGNTKIFASYFYPDSESELHPVETDEEWAMIADVIDQRQNEAMGFYGE